MVRVSDSETMIGMLNIKSRDGQTMCASIELQRSRKKAGKTVDLQRARVWHVSQSCDGMLGESLRARKGEGARTSGRRWCLTAVDQHEVGRVAAHEAAEERRLDVGDEGGGADDHATHGHQRVDVWTGGDGRRKGIMALRMPASEQRRGRGGSGRIQ